MSMNGNMIFHQTPVEDLRAIIVEAVAEQFKICQLNRPKEDELLNSKQVCSMLGITLPTLNLYKKRGEIVSCRIGNRILFRKSDILASLSEIKTTKSKKL